MTSMDTILAIDLCRYLQDGSKKGSKKEKYGCLFIEQSRMQAYVAPDLHRHTHGQLNIEEKNDYIDQLDTAGFVQVTAEDINKARPEKYYIVLKKEFDWSIPEIIVFNNFHNHPVLMELVKTLDIGRLANYLLVEKWDDTKHWIDPKRNNFQISILRNHLDQTDSTTISGMNIPRHHQKPIKFPGLDGDDNLEDTLVKMQVINTKIMDYITTFLIGEKIFMDPERREWFTKPDMRSRGIDEDAIRCDSGVFLFSGLLYTRSPEGSPTAKLYWHTDNHNDKRPVLGSNMNFCYNQMVSMYYDNRSEPVPARAALSQFNKKCIGDAMERIEATMFVANLVKDYIVEHGAGVIDWVGKMEQVTRLCNDNESDFAIVPADTNKDCYYAWFIHILFEMVFPVYGWNICVIVEFLFAITLTPSPVGFKYGVKYALNAAGNGNNFIYNFIKNMVFHHDAVAYHFGTKGRYQVSSQGVISHHSIQLSLRNLLCLIRYANESSSDSTKLYSTMTKSPYANNKTGYHTVGGVYGCGDLVALSIVKIATLVGAIGNHNHVTNVTIPNNTETAKRLKNVYGIATDAHRRELLNKLVEITGVTDRQILENCICEKLRLDSDEGSQGAEAIGLNYPLYQLDSGGQGLCVTDYLGQTKFVQFSHLHDIRKPSQYNPRYLWWNIDTNVPLDEQIGIDYDEILTRKSRLVQDYISNT